MTTKLVKSNRNIFIDTDTLTNESSAKAHILFPAHPFSVCCSDTIRISLQQFVMPRRIYNINVTNKVFYVRDTSADTYTEIIIAEGVYYTFATLASAIQTALRVHVALASVTCTYDDNIRRFSFGSLPENNIIVCWQSRATRPNGVSATGFFQQTHEILGGRPSRGAVPVDALGTGGVAPYPASLASIHSLYLRTNIMSGNYPSTGHERFLPNGNQVIESQIFARIPVDDPVSTNPIIFQDNGNDIFQLNPHSKSLDSLDLWLTDEFGRSLSEVSPLQYEDGMLNYTVTLRFEHLMEAINKPGFKTTSANIVTNKLI
jgi:hypothetical protein